MTLEQIRPKIKDLLESIFHNVPSGVGESGKTKLSFSELSEVIVKGAKWAAEKGYGTEKDLEHLEEQGCMKGADPEKISNEAKKRGAPQLGTLGAGNHFLEIQAVDKIFLPDVAKAFGIEKPGQVLVMIHTGSRGFGHQVCTDYLRILESKFRDEIKKLPDRELVYAPAGTNECDDYFSAMAAAANYAWTNRSMIMHWVRESFVRSLGMKLEDIGLEVIYDVAHNIGKIEEHEIDGKKVKVYLHRKGATRAFPAGHSEIPKDHQKVGQCVLLPGAMATASYVLVGAETAKETFYSTCFAPYTKVLTNKGLIKIEDIYEKIKDGEELLALSINENTLKSEWKKITNAIKKNGNLIRVSVSQQGRKKENTLDLTDDHKMITFNGLDICNKKVGDIVENFEMVCVLDRIPPLENLENRENEAYLAGVIFSDGYLRSNQVTFKQKENESKIEFINSVRSSFESIFNFPLIDVGTTHGGGIIDGRQIYGQGTEFRCSRKFPAEALMNLRENISEWVLRNNDETVRSYLAGIVDGDGTFNKSNNTIQIFSGKEKIIDSIILSCLRLGIVPYVSKNRSCLNIHITENKDLILEKTKRVLGKDKRRKYGTKLFSAKQLFGQMNLKWPFKQKSIRNNFMSKEVILRYLNRFKEKEREKLETILNSDVRMQRITKIEDLEQSEVFNITVEDNHNYIVFTSHFTPLVVKNCHGAGRVSSRAKMLRGVRGEEVARQMEKKGILSRAASWKVMAEEASEAYKNIDEVARVTEEAGISRRVCSLTPLGVIKG